MERPGPHFFLRERRPLEKKWTWETPPPQKKGCRFGFPQPTNRNALKTRRTKHGSAVKSGCSTSIISFCLAASCSIRFVGGPVRRGLALSCKSNATQKQGAFFFTTATWRLRLWEQLTKLLVVDCCSGGQKRSGNNTIVHAHGQQMILPGARAVSTWQTNLARLSHKQKLCRIISPPTRRHKFSANGRVPLSCLGPWFGFTGSRSRSFPREQNMGVLCHGCSPEDGQDPRLTLRSLGIDNLIS